MIGRRELYVRSRAAVADGAERRIGLCTECGAERQLRVARVIRHGLCDVCGSQRVFSPFDIVGSQTYAESLR